MIANSILLNEKDNIITTVITLKQGKKAIYFKGKELISIEVKTDIPSCHKIALKNLEKGELIIKYGEIIGRSLTEINEGMLVDHNNIESIPRNYSEEIGEC